MVVFTNESGLWTSQSIGIALNGVPNLFLGVGYVRKDNGNIYTPAYNFTNTPFIPIDPTKDLQIKAYEGVTNLMAFCAFYDSDYKFISVWQPGGSADGSRTATIPAAQIPANTVYIRCSGHVSKTDNYVIPFDLYNVLVNLATKTDVNAVIAQINTYLMVVMCIVVGRFRQRFQRPINQMYFIWQLNRGYIQISEILK